MIRPSVPGPTGTEMGAPVLAASIPRTRPSVESIAMHRTVFSPRCCCTSSTRLPTSSLIDGLLTRSAEKIGGSVPAPNSTSTTLPGTWVIFPGAISGLIMGDFLSSGEGLGGAHYVHQLAGDLGLTGAVHRER